MKVLLPLDGSDAAQNTLAWVAEASNPIDTVFYILTVIEKGAAEELMEEYQVEDALTLLKQAETHLTGKGFKVAKAEYVIGDPTGAICRYAEETDVDQIIIGANGRSGFGKMLFGSVSSAVFEHAKVPVFIFKNKHPLPGKTLL